MANKLPKAGELRAQDDHHLAETLKETIKSHFDLRFRSASDRTTAAGESRQLRKQIARIKTVQRERELKKAES
jgi:large subunit ribosomal protein L29